MAKKETKAKKSNVCVAKVSDKIHNGQGGKFRKGAEFELDDADARKTLKERGLIE